MNVQTTDALPTTAHFLTQMSRLVEEKINATPSAPVSHKQQKALAQISLHRHEWEERQMPPLAIVPTTLWNHLCDSFDLYRFEYFFEDGAVPCQKTSYTPSNITDAIGFITLFGTIGAISQAPNYFMVIAIGIPTLSSCILSILEQIYEKEARRKGVTDAQIYFPRKYAGEGLIVRDEEGGLKYSSIQVSFHKAPADVQALQARLDKSGIAYHIAAEESGFELHLGSVQHHDSLKRDPDPIIYVNRGDWTIVLAQYGNFSREKELITYVQGLNVYHFI